MNVRSYRIECKYNSHHMNSVMSTVTVFRLLSSLWQNKQNRHTQFLLQILLDQRAYAGIVVEYAGKSL